MPSDKSTRIETHRPPDWKLPEIRAVEMRAALYEPRRPRNFESPLRAARDAVEFVVRLAAPLPARALRSGLWAGEKRLTESQRLCNAGKEFRCWAFQAIG